MTKYPWYGYSEVSGRIVRFVSNHVGTVVANTRNKKGPMYKVGYQSNHWSMHSFIPYDPVIHPTIVMQKNRIYCDQGII